MPNKPGLAYHRVLAHGTYGQLFPETEKYYTPGRMRARWFASLIRTDMYLKRSPAAKGKQQAFRLGSLHRSEMIESLLGVGIGRLTSLENHRDTAHLSESDSALAPWRVNACILEKGSEYALRASKPHFQARAPTINLNISQRAEYDFVDLFGKLRGKIQY